MPVTVINLDKKSGHFELENSQGRLVGTGRAKASKTHPGMVTLFFSPSALPQLGNGLRVPIDWLST